MIKVETYENMSFRLSGIQFGKDYAGYEALKTIEYRAIRTPNCYDYPKMIDACCTAAAPIVRDLLSKGYEASMFLVGAPLNEQQQARFTNYKLASPALKKKLFNNYCVEMKFIDEKFNRMAGLYHIGRKDICRALHFIFVNSWASLIFSSRSNYITEENLKLVYNAAHTDISSNTLVAMNWEIMALILCPYGDVVVKTWCIADDLYRHIVLISKLRQDFCEPDLIPGLTARDLRPSRGGRST